MLSPLYIMTHVIRPSCRIEPPMNSRRSELLGTSVASHGVTQCKRWSSR